MTRKLIVTHHAPDLDAIGAVWLLKRFDSQHYADAKVEFVPPGSQIEDYKLRELGINKEDVIHVDTGLGEFDHHQPENGHKFICATSLVFDYICQIQPDKKDNKALKTIVDFVTEIDHFKEIYWPDADSLRYEFMIHQLIEGLSQFDPHNNDSLLNFGMTCLDAVYTQLTQVHKADELIETMGQTFTLPQGECLAIETDNNDVTKRGQKRGFMMVVRKDQQKGNIRIKVRPDADMDLKPVADEISKLKDPGEWFYHPSGKMLLNGSSKKQHKPSQLSLKEVVQIIKQIYVK